LEVEVRLLVATTNADKFREIETILGDAPIQLLSLRDFPSVPEPDETGTTFQENARLKAVYYGVRATPNLLTVAEDSGLAIDALGGEPGVQSARFLGQNASYPERFEEIYRRFSGVASRDRTARFVCALAVASGDRIVFETTGVVEGRIAEAPRGSAGFGYDPIFYFPPYGRTLAEVSQEEKLRVAHRGHAFRGLVRWLSQETRNGER
jgi:XTP/dITP diphosphohydrolase